MRADRLFATATDPLKILILHGGALGDLVLLIPTLRRLRTRFPGSKLVLLGSPYSGSVLEDLPYLDELILSYRKINGTLPYFRTLFQLRKRKFDLLIDLHSTSRSLQQTAIIRARHSIGMKRGDAGDRIYDELISRNHDNHMVHEYLHLVNRLGIMDFEEADLCLELPISAQHRAEADRLLQECDISGPFAVIHPTTSGRPKHEVWPIERFAEVAKFLSSRAIAVVASSDKERGPLVTRLQELSQVPIGNMAGKTPPLVLAALLEKSQLYFGYNTGPMHIACASGTRVVAFFENPQKYHHWHPHTSAKWMALMPGEIQNESEKVFDARTISVDQATAAISNVLESHALFPG